MLQADGGCIVGRLYRVGASPQIASNAENHKGEEEKGGNKTDADEEVIYVTI